MLLVVAAAAFGPAAALSQEAPAPDACTKVSPCLPNDKDCDGLPDHAEIKLGIHYKNTCDSDGDGILDRDEDKNADAAKTGNGVVDAGETDPANPDTDGDGIMDGAELGGKTITVNLKTVTIANNDIDEDGIPNNLDRDSDNDGISDRQELSGQFYPGRAVQSNPYLANTDDDGVNDLDEVKWGTDPSSANTDGDGWNDGVEVTNRTNPLKPDTDGDTIDDGTGSDGAADTDGDGIINALDVDSDNDGVDDAQELALRTNPVLFDTDGDGYPDGYEYHRQAAGFDPLLNTKPAVGKDATHKGDTDGDGIPDGIEVAWWKTNPNSDDSDGDGIKDLAEGVDQAGMPLDSDKDGLINALDRDSDNDGVSDKDETAGGTQPYNPNSDTDGLSDGAEVNVFKTNPKLADSDGDDLSDGDEIKNYRTDPWNPDTDGDGIWDGDERSGRDLRLNHSDAQKVVIDGAQVVVPNDDADKDGIKNWIDDDSDNDGISDKNELSGDTYRYKVEATWYGPGFVSSPVKTNPYNVDTDRDGLWDSYEARLSYTNPVSGDTDSDNITDAKELGVGTLPDGQTVTPQKFAGHDVVTDPHMKNTDRDFVDDDVEMSSSWQTNPINPDTDGDGIKDGEELTITYKIVGGTKTAKFLENNVDLDGDGKINALDPNSSINFKTTVSNNFRDRSKMGYAAWAAANHPNPGGWQQGSPLNPGTRDSDGDNYLDTDEIRAGSDPLDATSHAQTDLVDQDPDGDGLYNLEEAVLGTKQNDANSDADGLKDGRELDPEGIDENHDGITYWKENGSAAQRVATNPNAVNSDLDDRNDNVELASSTDPLWDDTDGDGLADNENTSDPVIADSDQDGLLDHEEVIGTSRYAPPVNLPLRAKTDPRKMDTDGDDKDLGARWTPTGLMNDGMEAYVWGTNPRSDLEPADTKRVDADLDGIKDNEEVYNFSAGAPKYSTNPQVADTDHDGTSDGDEEKAANPTLANDRDTDSDYLIDGYEVNRDYTSNGHAYAQLPKNLKAYSNNSDGDGVLDGAEAALGIWARMAVNKETNKDMDEPDDDADGLNDGVEAPGDGSNAEALAFQTGKYKADPGSKDSDGDEIWDSVELDDSQPADADKDGANNAMDVDADNDWIRDGTTNPGSPKREIYADDLDDDGIFNALDGDSYDNDNLLDPLELVLFESDKATGDSDYDEDGLLDGNEYYHSFFNPISNIFPADNRNGIRVKGGNPRRPDSDGDGLTDGLEVGLTAYQTAISPSAGVGGTAGSPPVDSDGLTSTKPWLWDSDFDGLADATEDADKNGRVDAGETNPYNADSDDDNLPDGTDKVLANALRDDTDYDSLNDGLELGFYVVLPVAPEAGIDATVLARGWFTDPNDYDTDNDGLWDGNDSKDQPNAPEAVSRGEDTDLNGVVGALETDPVTCDTDNDQVNDSYDTAPTNPNAGGAELTAASPTGTINLALTDPAASHFAVLANAAMTGTDGTIAGDVGTFLAPPTGSVTLTRCPITGTVHVGDGVAKQAFNGFLSAYATLAPKPGDISTTLTGTLAGVTLSPGVYNFDAAATLTGVLTLNGPSDGIWIFKIGTSGTGALTGTNFSVVLAGGGQASNVTWWVAQGATMTDSHLSGTILAGAGITLTRGAFDGNAWSKADVTINGTAVTGWKGSGPPLTKAFFTGATTLSIENSSVNPKADPIANFYVVTSNFIWQGDENAVQYANPYTCTKVLKSEWITLKARSEGEVAYCAPLARGEANKRTYDVAVSVPTGLLPGKYTGRIYFVASELACRNLLREIKIDNVCSDGSKAVPTMAPNAYIEYAIVVPPRFDLDVLNDDEGTDKAWGVGKSDPAGFHAAAKSNEMHLKGLFNYNGKLTGVFQLSNPNVVANASEVNCRPSSPKWDWDTDAQGNTRIEKVGVGFVQTAGPTVGNKLSFAPKVAGGFDNFDLGAQQSVIVALNTAGIGSCDNGRIEGTVEVWRDQDGNGKRDQTAALEPLLDTFVLKIELVSPDFDIAAILGSLSGTKLSETVDLGKQLPIWTLQAGAICDATVNSSGTWDAHDGRGCEGWQDAQLFNPLTKAETPITFDATKCGVEPTPATTFSVVRYDANNPSNPWDTANKFDVKLWACQNKANCGDAVEYFVKVPTGVASLNLKDGLYRPYYASSGAGSSDNGYVVMSARGQATSFTRADATGDGYPVVYKGGDRNSSTWGYFDRFEVALTLVNPPCALTFTPSPLTLPSVYRLGSTSAKSVLGGCAIHPVEALSASSLILTGPSGATIVAQVSLSSTTIPTGGTIDVTVRAEAGLNPAGNYTGDLTVTSSKSGETSKLTVNMAINPPCTPTFTQSPLAFTVQPLVAATGDATVRACAGKAITNAVATISTLKCESGSEQIADATVTLDGTTITATGTGLHVRIPASNYKACVYRGKVTVASTADPLETAELDVAVTVAAPCGPSIAGSITIASTNPGQQGSGSASVSGCTQPLSGLTASVTTLTREDGRDQITDAVATIDATSLPVGGPSTTLRVSVNAGPIDAAHLAGVYTGTAKVTAGNGLFATTTVTFRVAEAPSFSASTNTVTLQNEECRLVTVHNAGNTDLKGLSAAVSGIAFVSVSPTTRDANWHGPDAEFTICADPPGSQPANLYTGLVTFSHTGATPAKVEVKAGVTSNPATITTITVPPVARGQQAQFKICIRNDGNDDLVAVSAQLGNLVPSRPGGKSISGPSQPEAFGELLMDVEEGSVCHTVPVPVSEGFFCGEYNAVVKVIGKTASGEESEELVSATVTVTGCETTPLAFSKNPVHFAQNKSVDIAFASGGSVSVKIYNMYGVLIRELANKQSTTRLSWDFKNDKGDLVASGMYLIAADVDGKQIREKLLFVK